jgi:hypothetical protein
MVVQVFPDIIPTPLLNPNAEGVKKAIRKKAMRIHFAAEPKLKSTVLWGSLRTGIASRPSPGQDGHVEG